MLQVADLFTSTIGRRLNATSAKKGAKDEFAEHFVGSVGLASSTIKDEVRGGAVYHLMP